MPPILALLIAALAPAPTGSIALKITLAALALAGSALFSFTRVSLMRSVPDRVLARLEQGRHRERLARMLSDIDALVTSAGTLRVACDLCFAVLVLGLVAGDAPLNAGHLALAAACGLPLLALAVEVVPHALVDARGDDLLRAFLPTFKIVQFPVAPFARVLARLRRGVAGLAGFRGTGDTTRRIVENLREVVHDSEIDTELDANEREIIENVMEFHDVDVAAIMTPRTEIVAIDVRSDLRAAIALAAEAGHGRLPVHRGSLDEVVGTFVARDVLALVAQGSLDAVTLESVVRPIWFVPETKRVSELLEEFRRQRIKVAVVVDEYGGTAGLVTLGDVLSELVGDIQDEFDDDEEPAEVRRLTPNSAEVLAAARVSDVNAELELDLPEDGDYETLGGFVLAELGHFPTRGEVVQHGSVRVTVLDSNERRVLSLRLDWDPVDAASGARELVS